MAQTMTMIGATMANGIRRIEANSGTVASTTIRLTTLPRYMLAIRPQTKSCCSTNSVGPGCSPQIIRPPSITAAVAVSIGSRALVPALWSAVSGAITPSTSPLPKFSRFFEKRRARL